MQASEMNVQILSPKRPLATLKAKSVRIPGSEGEMEILSNHAPLVAQMGMGYLRAEAADGKEVHKFFVVGGYVNVLNNTVTVLANIAETPTEVIQKRAEDAKKRAEERLARREAHIDLNRAQAALYRALARLQFIDAVNKEKTH